MKHKKPHMRHKNTANYILYSLGIFLFLFTAAMVVTYWKYQSVPDTLIQYVLGASGVESFSMALIKSTKVKQQNKSGTSSTDSSEAP